MKKRNRVLALVLTACLVFGMTPQYVAAEEDSATIEVAGEIVLPGEYYKTTKEGTLTAGSASDYNVSFVEGDSQCTLTLNNATITADDIDGEIDYGAGIRYENDKKPLEIVVKGVNTVNGKVDCGYSNAIHVAYSDLIISGDGELRAYGGEITKDYDYFTCGIRVVSGADLIVKSGTITAIGGKTVAGTYGILASGTNIYIEGGTVYANCALENGIVVSKVADTGNGCNVGIFNDTAYAVGDDIGNVVITGGKIYTYGGKSDVLSGGIVAQNNITIKNGEVNAVAGTVNGGRNYGIGATKNLMIENATVNATGGKVLNDESSYGIGAEGTVTIKNSNVKSVGGEVANASSFGIGCDGDLSITGGDTSVTGGTSGAVSYGIGCKANVKISEGIVVATSGAAPAAFGIGAEKTLTIEKEGKVFAKSSVQAIGAIEGVTVGDGYEVYAGDSEEKAQKLQTIPKMFPAAKYTKVVPLYTVSFDGNGGSGTINSVTAAYGTTITLPENKFAAPDKEQEFQAWAVNSKTGKQYATKSAYTITGNTTFYAIWKTIEKQSESVTKKIKKKHITLKYKNKNQSKVKYSKVSGADGYKVYAQYCDKDFTKKVNKTIKASEKNIFTINKINGKKLNQKKVYKFYVVAYKLVDGKEKIIGQSVVAHVVAKKNTTYTNVKKVKVTKTKYTLKSGKKAQIEASVVKQYKDRKQIGNDHTTEIRYESSNKKVAKVTKNGKIQAVGKGNCTIYVYARNGMEKKITVKVK